MKWRERHLIQYCSGRNFEQKSVLGLGNKILTAAKCKELALYTHYIPSLEEEAKSLRAHVTELQEASRI